MTWVVLVAVNYAVMVYGSNEACQMAAFRAHMIPGQYACVAIDKSQILGSVAR